MIARETCDDTDQDQEPTQPHQACSIEFKPIPHIASATTSTQKVGRKPATDRPWRDIPLSEFPEAWQTELTRELNGGPPEPNWVCGPCVCTDVSTDIERGNFMTLWNRLCQLSTLTGEDGPPKDWSMISAKHWTAGEMEFIFVRPGSEAHKLCDRVRLELAEYPDLTRKVVESASKEKGKEE